MYYFSTIVVIRINKELCSFFLFSDKFVACILAAVFRLEIHLVGSFA